MKNYLNFIKEDKQNPKSIILSMGFSKKDDKFYKYCKYNINLEKALDDLEEDGQISWNKEEKKDKTEYVVSLTKINEAETLIAKFLNDLVNLGKTLGIEKEDQIRVDAIDNAAKSKPTDLQKNLTASYNKVKLDYGTELDAATDVPSIKKTTQDYLKIIYASLTGIAANTKNNAFLPITFFNNPEVTTYKNTFGIQSKDFKGRLEATTNIILTQVGKKAGVDDNELKKLLTAKVGSKPAAAPTTPEAPAAEAKPTTEAPAAEAKPTTETPAAPVNASIKLDNNLNKINEAETPAAEGAFDIEKFKLELKNYINLLIDNINKSITNTIKKAASNPATNLMGQLANQKAKTIGSKPENILKFYNFINNLDKENLIKVRDTLSNNKIINKADYLI